MGSDGPKESCVTWGSKGAEGRCHGNRFWLSMGYNFGCIIASDTLFDSTGGFFGSSYPMKTAEIECLRVVAMVTNFGTKIAINGFV